MKKRLYPDGIELDNVGTKIVIIGYQPMDLLGQPDTDHKRLLLDTQIEIIREVQTPLKPEHVLFDFDGTLSLIREGWPSVMIPMMVEIIQQTGTDETPESISQKVESYVQRLNGKQTIYQMIQLAEEVKQRGGMPEDPQAYKEIYHQRLMRKISVRREALRQRSISPSDLMVPGAVEFLEALRSLGFTLYLASGTDEHYVKEEAQLLGLDPFFGDHLYGAVTDFKNFSKKKVIEKILKDNQIDGSRLIGIGDGYVEIQNVRSVGGFAVAVASDEAGRSGKPDPWKRRRLIGVGADIVIPDFREYRALIKYLFGRQG